MQGQEQGQEPGFRHLGRAAIAEPDHRSQPETEKPEPVLVGRRVS
jgi:hypothetical protein